MEIEYDPAKDLKNRQAHGLSLGDVHRLDWDNAIYKSDGRRDYGEERIQAFAYGLDDKKPYAVILTLRGDIVRIISFRRANKREERLLEKENTHGEQTNQNNEGGSQ